MVVSCPLSPRALGWPCRMAVCCPAMSQSPEREGWRLPGGTVAGCHVGLEGKKIVPLCFLHSVRVYGIALLFLQCWL